MNKSNNSLAWTVAVFAFFCASPSANAAQVQAVGPVEVVAGRAAAITVLGQTFRSTAALSNKTVSLGVGDYVAITGEWSADGTLVAKSIVRLSTPYTPGADEVFLRAMIKSLPSQAGILKIGGVQIALSQALTGSQQNLSPGKTIEVVGTQPLPGGVIWASEIQVEAVGNETAELQSIQGTGANALSIQGTGSNALSIQGTGKQSIQGTGASTLSIQGTGVSAQSIQGTGKQSIQGTGASTLSIQGTGASAQSIQGTGKQSIQGTGANTLSIQGTG